ncbi:hypothetical protein [Paenibacillus sp. N3.4]|uniref:hypothetical protein n=1 Tax=Paenibacillus sp. N3.4 TaxID=2603222 RepID=UPI0011C922F0|nr:hypothetical protein [Paenibacillus sp. N3.4]TXK82563.1 hypothetical protein FU659_14610 [Paenibacillus sp. N3.4]
MFKPNDYLADAVKNKNLIRIYNEFSVIAHEDPSFSTGKFMRTLEYIESQSIPGLFKEHEERQITYNDAYWNDAYWALIVSSLLDNFSHKRIDHLKTVSQYLYGKKEDKENKENKEVITRTLASTSRNQRNTTPETHRAPTRVTYAKSSPRGIRSKKARPIALMVGIALIILVVWAVGIKVIATVTITIAIIVIILRIYANRRK